MAISITTTVNPSTYPSVAVASLPFLRNGDAAGLQTVAQQYGFQNVGPNQYQHPDGSWVALINNRIERGYGNAQFVGIPAPIARNAQRQQAQPVRQAQPAPVQTPAPGGTYSSIPSNQWSWYQQNTVLGRLPMLSNQATDQATLMNMGMTQQGSRWVAPDGTWVDYSTGRARLGFQQWTLGQLPYNNRTSAR